MLKHAKFISMPDDKLIEYTAFLLHGRTFRFYKTLPPEVIIGLFKLFLRWILGIFNIKIQSEKGHKFV